MTYLMLNEYFSLGGLYIVEIQDGQSLKLANRIAIKALQLMIFLYNITSVAYLKLQKLSTISYI